MIRTCRGGAIALLLLGLFACVEAGARGTSPTAPLTATALQVRTSWNADIVNFRRTLSALDSALVRVSIVGDRSSKAEAIARFRDARLAFKQTEFLSAYYEPTTTRAINGPALPDVEEDEGPEVVFPPEGLQVIEDFIFVDLDSTRAVLASAETRNVLDFVTRLETTASRQRITDDRVFDAAKMEIARVTTLGISGFDSPLAKLSITEAASALHGVHSAMAAYRAALGESEWRRLDVAFSNAHAQLRVTGADGKKSREASFNDFDRLRFIVTAANPLAQALVRARDHLQLGAPREARVFRMRAVTIFDSGAIVAEGFAPPGTERASIATVALGRSLFFDVRLSGDGSRSCASCHDPARAFTDGRARSMARSAKRQLRNAPTIINAGLQVGSFYDLRATFLEDQITDVLGNPDEMHGNADATAVRLMQDTAYVRKFRAAFSDSARVTGRQLRSAIAAYIRSLEALNSRVDRALRGDTTQLSLDERTGFNLFMGKAKCGTCHFAPLFNGTIPPNYQESEFEVLGVPATVDQRAHIDPDSGRFRQSRAAPHLHAFKVPTVRNISLTAPYMHNGVFQTLEQVVEFYNGGGGVGRGMRLNNQTLPADSLRLTALEQRALIRFMRALTDTTGTTRRN